MESAQPSVFIFWLCGLPGSGKSTVAKTVAKFLHDEQGCLGASFFFSRDDEECNSYLNVMSTIARQLAFFNPDVALYITDFLASHPDAGSDSMAYQLQHLIIEPLRKAHSKSPLSPFVIVMDALDECIDSDKAQIILDLLAAEFRKLPFPVLLFITSRPEFHLESKFESNLISPISSCIRLHELDHSTVTVDIEHYLAVRLAELGKITSTLLRIAPEGLWPHPRDVKALAEKASGLFIFAATVVKFIGDERCIPEDQMRIMLDLQVPDDPFQQRPYALIDGLYLQILHNSISCETEGSRVASDIHMVIGAIATLQNPLSYDALMRFLGILRDVLRRLSSVIHYPRSRDDNVRFMHQSFPDFLARCPDPLFHVDPIIHHAWLARFSLQLLLSNSLHRGMCPDLTPSKFNLEVPDAQKSIDAHLAYACVHFMHHVSSGCLEDDEILNQLNTLLKTKLLCWFEALSLVGCLEVAITILKQIEQWYRVKNYTISSVHF